MSQAMKWYQLDDTGMVCDLSAGIAKSHINTTSHTISNNNLDIVSPSLDSYSSRQIFSAQPLLPANLRGLAYGDGFFTTMGIYQGCVLWQSYHQARVANHLKSLFLYIEPKIIQALWQAVVQFAKAIKHGIIKLIFSRQAQSQKGYAHSATLSENTCHIWLGVLQTAPLANKMAHFLAANVVHDKQDSDVVLQQQPIVVTCLDAQLCSYPSTLAGLKSLNRLDGVLIAGELERRKQKQPQLSEGLVKDITGAWVEGVMSNMFYQLNTGNTSNSDSKLKSKCIAHSDSQTKPKPNTWFTPPIVHAGVRGVMRTAIMDILAQKGQAVVERPLNDDDLTHIEAMFFCNAVRGVMPVQTLLCNQQSFVLSLQVFN